MNDEQHYAGLLAANQEAADHFTAGRVLEASAAWEALVYRLRPQDDNFASGLYENLALAYTNLGRWDAAIRGFRRALDGDPVAREQSSRYLSACLVRRGRLVDARRQVAAYERAFGDFPDGWVVDALSP